MTLRVLGTEHVFPLSRENIESKKDAKKKSERRGEKERERDCGEKDVRMQCSGIAG